MMRSSNPFMQSSSFIRDSSSGSTMTLNGTVNKTMILTLILLATAAYPWYLFFNGSHEYIRAFMIGGAIGGLVLSITTYFKKEWAPITAPLYAAVEGLFLGAVSAVFEALYPGIVIQAVFLTMGTLLCLLLAYKTGMIKATENFKLGVVAATGAIGMVYGISFLLGLFGVNIGFIHGNGIFAILFSVFAVVVAALNLVMDFDFIEEGAAEGAPKHMEWFAAFGLMVTLIWLYIEFLRLLSKLKDN